MFKVVEHCMSFFLEDVCLSSPNIHRECIQHPRQLKFHTDNDEQRRNRSFYPSTWFVLLLFFHEYHQQEKKKIYTDRISCQTRVPKDHVYLHKKRNEMKKSENDTE